MFNQVIFKYIAVGSALQGLVGARKLSRGFNALTDPSVCIHMLKCALKWCHVINLEATDLLMVT